MRVEEAIKASMSCKSWLSAWTTGPNLEFVFVKHCGFLEVAEFFGSKPLPQKRRHEIYREGIKYQQLLEHINTTLRRYHPEKLPIQSFKIHPYRFEDGRTPDFLEEWVQIALQKGAKTLDLGSYSAQLPLPELVLVSKNLVELLLHNFVLFKLDIQHCHQLKRLHLHHVKFADQLAFGNLMSSCESIESLEFRNCELNLYEQDIFHRQQQLKRLALQFSEVDEFTFGNLMSCFKSVEDLVIWRGAGMEDFVIPELPCLQKLSLYGCRLTLLHPCPNLNHLRLVSVNVTNTFFQDLDNNCPNLKYLYLYVTGDCSLDSMMTIKISSSSLEILRLNTYHEEILVHAPNMIRFEFTTSSVRGVPNLYITGSSNQWTSRIEVRSPKVLDHSFYKLKNLVSNISQSKISFLKFRTLSEKVIFDINEVMDDMPFSPPYIEHLSLRGRWDENRLTCLLDGIFWCCRPKTLSLSWSYVQGSDPFVDVVMNIQRQNHNQNGRKLWANDLKQVKVEATRYDDRTYVLEWGK
ncbi:OLC1v1009985C1 [Oldenlandia corymbosa var. corymbosa]|uniref:OLC1v1009985C1 n=1 Tax=Oldenlandia corymbosa var. corymbosa TaxID=529605 RepID=A0AAV1DQ73_OLDCO|nr:OLC1v1009985C1 [Oldenlandia corymbosa var. corymbosa]